MAMFCLVQKGIANMHITFLTKVLSNIEMETQNSILIDRYILRRINKLTGT